MASYQPGFAEDEFRISTAHYLLPNKTGKRIIYTYIRKNACSSFKHYMVQHLPDAPRNPDISVFKPFLQQVPIGQAPEYDEAIFVYRDPVSRAISTFIDKFTHSRTGSADIYRSYHKITGKDPEQASFADYVDYLHAGFTQTDPHTWPQKSHLFSGSYHHAIPIGRLTGTMQRILGPDSAHLFPVVTNKSTRTNGQRRDDEMSRIGSEDLRRMIAGGINLTKANFADADLQARLRDLYAVDIAMIAGLTS